MLSIQTLKKLWKKLGLKGRIKNYSTKPLWVIESDSPRPTAHLLGPMQKSPSKMDTDGFKRFDGKPIEGHSSWWKYYDYSTMEVFDKGSDLRLSVITKVAVLDYEFSSADNPIIFEKSENWGEPIQLITGVKRNKKKRIIKYLVSGKGWLDPKMTLLMACKGEIDNARPVFPKGGSPYLRTRRDKELFNNLELKG